MNEEIIENIFQNGLSHHQSGRIAQAKDCYNEILKFRPSHYEVLYLLGVISAQEKEWSLALSLIGKAIKLNSQNAFYYNDYANILTEIGKPKQAIRDYDKAISINPNYIEAYINRGIALAKINRLDDAIRSYNMAITLNPNFAQTYNNLGSALKSAGRMVESIENYEKAIRLKPNYSSAYFNLGNAQKEIGDIEGAITNYKASTHFNPSYAEAYYNLGNSFRELNQLENALDYYDKAINTCPSYLDAYNNRGQVLLELGRVVEAARNYERAVFIKKDCAELYYNLGNAYRELKKPDYAIASYDQAINLKKNYSEAYFNKSIVQLLLGDMENGFKNYEYRKVGDAFYKKNNYGKLWLGKEDLMGKSILVTYEQGLGDTIQFCRYITLLENSGAQVYFFPQQSLRKLLCSINRTSRMITEEDMKTIKFDYYCPLMTLPLSFKTRINTIPCELPYLEADQKKIIYWKNIIGNNGFKIAVNWEGSILGNALRRSFPIENLKRLSRMRGVRLISIQKNITQEKLAGIPDELSLENLGNEFDSGQDAFLDTAAIMKCCDLVITCDSATAHLGGALGLPTWIALKFIPHWTWMLDRTGSPWYPTVRIFRQKMINEWSSVFEDMENEFLALYRNQEF